MSGPLVVVVGATQYVTLWRACVELSRRHGATSWAYRGGKFLEFSNSSGRCASYRCVLAAGGRLHLFARDLGDV